MALSQPAAQVVLVPYTEAGTATPQVDYRVESPNPLLIPAGEASASLLVTIAHDTAQEPNETVVLTLRQPTNAVVGAQVQRTLTIVDND